MTTSDERFNILKLKEFLKDHLSKKRYKHTLSVAHLAIELANLYNVDAYKAEIAALGHDIAKEMSKRKMIKYIEKYHIIVDPSIDKNPNLAHGEIGAIILKTKFNIDDEEILEAVRWHTYGNKEMSLLSKIVYMADVVEDSRDFEGVDELRVLVRKDINSAILYFFELSKIYLDKEDLLIHQNTYHMIKSIKEENFK